MNTNYHIVWFEDKVKLRRGKSSKAIKTYNANEFEIAIERGKELAEKATSVLYVHKANGTLKKVFNYQGKG